MSYFVYNDIDSREYGVIRNAPLPPMAVETVEELDIIGRNEHFMTHTERFANIELTFELGFKDRSKLREMYVWLRGTGDLTVNERPDEVFKVKNVLVSSERVSLRFGKLTVTFICSPFTYMSEPTIADITNQTITIENDGSIFSEPLIVIEPVSGNNEIVINTNGDEFKIQTPEEIANSDGTGYEIIVECEAKICYFIRPNGDKVNCTHCTFGKFPVLRTGSNSITQTGDVRTATINARERFV